MLLVPLQSFVSDMQRLTRRHTSMKCYGLGLGLDTFRIVSLGENFRRLDPISVMNTYSRLVPEQSFFALARCSHAYGPVSFCCALIAACALLTCLKFCVTLSQVIHSLRDLIRKIQFPSLGSIGTCHQKCLHMTGIVTLQIAAGACMSLAVCMYPSVMGGLQCLHNCLL